VSQSLRSLGHMLFSGIKSKRLEVRALPTVVLWCCCVLCQATARFAAHVPLIHPSVPPLRCFGCSFRCQDAIELSCATNPPAVSVQLDNMKAMVSLDKGNVDPDSSDCLFVQGFQQFPRKGTHLWRSKIDARGRLFNVKYVGV
jgi:hypothetical protein